MTARTELIERLRAAEAGSRALDWTIAHEFSESHTPEVCPTYTASLDAALNLAARFFPGWHWEIELWPGETTVQGAPEYWGEGYVAADRGGAYETAKTPALAFAAALVSAKGLNP